MPNLPLSEIVSYLPPQCLASLIAATKWVDIKPFYTGSSLREPKSVRARAKPNLFFARALRQSRPKVVQISWLLMNALKKGDSVKRMESIVPKERGWVDTKLGPLVDDATALNMAVRFARRRCVRYLLNVLNATVDVPDGRGMSPVGCAAWIGDDVLLKELLDTGQPVNLERLGTPFKTSSCGGEGPYKPREWARRKG
eukprot:CAMPEP_0118665334 /NCGR_PEP_ID=MMETSP0785-20121206/18561_1 /TAXON_ID=91992 /ORGANISM="Bolidomonas pacifica, Strain CCMP 1866" /LENGTH=197 /DNA_ID=CAMNT_0006559441 /DNA_START=72 /DNA_END=661 /DNA_ORIENTATION=+